MFIKARCAITVSKYTGMRFDGVGLPAPMDALFLGKGRPCWVDGDVGLEIVDIEYMI